MAQKIIIDCDPGVDDALALILAFHSPEVEVLAVSGVSGNVPLDMVWENLHRVLSLIRPSAKPLITRGAGRPLRGEPVFSFRLPWRGRAGRRGRPLERKEAFLDLF